MMMRRYFCVEKAKEKKKKIIRGSQKPFYEWRRTFSFLHYVVLSTLKKKKTEEETKEVIKKKKWR